MLLLLLPDNVTFFFFQGSIKFASVGVRLDRQETKITPDVIKFCEELLQQNKLAFLLYMKFEDKQRAKQTADS